MNIILLVVDSLRFDTASAADLPFLRRLDAEALCFRRAYATIRDRVLDAALAR